MCGLLTLLLLVGGFLGFFGISSAVVMPIEPIGSVQVTVVQSLEMTPTFTPTPLMAEMTPTPERTAARLLAPTLTPSPTALAPADPQILSICAPPEQGDLQEAAKFEGNILQSPAWMLSATSTASMTRFTWNNSAYGSVAMLELLHYDCGYTDDDIDTFYSDGVWDTLFASYESWEETAVCFVGRLRLHEFATTYAGANYTIRYWVDPISDQRVAAFMLVYPEWGLDEMDVISAQLRPDLPACGSL